ncbi:MAG TPA: hypothetical protein VK712_00725, partial [Verrucomicrobiae bacterium]|nr:hypothetical protein [Verrucomicrobiae bacterium]
MAEPERVYNDQDAQPVTRPDLRALEGGGETSPPRRDHLSSVDGDKDKGTDGGSSASSGGSP